MILRNIAISALISGIILAPVTAFTMLSHGNQDLYRPDPLVCSKITAGYIYVVSPDGSMGNPYHISEADSCSRKLAPDDSYLILHLVNGSDIVIKVSRYLYSPVPVN
jgi:hypothetical protein